MDDYKPESRTFTDEERNAIATSMIKFRYQYGEWKMPQVFVNDDELNELYFNDHSFDEERGSWQWPRLSQHAPASLGSCVHRSGQARHDCLYTHAEGRHARPAGSGQAGPLSCPAFRRQALSAEDRGACGAAQRASVREAALAHCHDSQADRDCLPAWAKLLYVHVPWLLRP